MTVASDPMRGSDPQAVPPPRSRMDAVLRAGANLSKLAGLVAAAMGFALIVVVMLGVIGRTMRTTTFGWSFEISGYLLAGMVFLGTAYAALTDGLIRVQLLTQRLGDRATRALRLLASVLAVGFGLLFLWMLWQYFSYTLERGLHSESLLETPLWIPQTVMIVGTGLFVVELVRQLVQRAREMRAAPGEDGPR